MAVAKPVSICTSLNGHLVSMDGKIIYDIADDPKNINYVCCTNITMHHDNTKHLLFVDFALYSEWYIIYVDESELDISRELREVALATITKEVDDRWDKEIKSQLIEQKRKQLDALLTIVNKLQEDLDSDSL